MPSDFYLIIDENMFLKKSILFLYICTWIIYQNKYLGKNS